MWLILQRVILPSGYSGRPKMAGLKTNGSENFESVSTRPQRWVVSLSGCSRDMQLRGWTLIHRLEHGQGTEGAILLIERASEQRFQVWPKCHSRPSE
jgi:hypothetical protein